MIKSSIDALLASRPDGYQYFLLKELEAGLKSLNAQLDVLEDEIDEYSYADKIQCQVFSTSINIIRSNHGLTEMGVYPEDEPS